MYALVNDTIYNDEVLCDTSNHEMRMMRIKTDTGATAMDDTITTIYKLFPNPAKDVLKVISNNPFTAGSRLIVYDVEGRKQMEYPLPTGLYIAQVNTTDLQPSSYIAVILSGSESKYHNKLVIIK